MDLQVTKFMKAIFLNWSAEKGSRLGLRSIWRDANQNAAQILNDAQALTDMEVAFTHLFVDGPYSNGNNGWSKWISIQNETQIYGQGSQG